jgi:hypothetical protein
VFIVRDIATDILLDRFAVGDPALAEMAEMTTGGR